jgi:hypothetical protein
MGPEAASRWASDDEFFDTGDGLAGHLAARLDSGVRAVSFARDGCWFRLSCVDDAGPETASPPAVSQRTYLVELVTNSPNCARGNLFTTTWPEGCSHGPVNVAAPSDPDAPGSAGRTLRDISRLLGTIEDVLWPES